MKIRLLFFIILTTAHAMLFSQVLYSSTTEVGNRFNPGIGKAGTPNVAFDDVSIPNAVVAASDSIIVTKVKVGIRRTPGAPATEVKIYYTPFDDTSTQQSTCIKTPPVLLGTVSLPALGSSLQTTIVSVGDSVSALFKMKTDTSRVYPGYHTFFIGVALSNDNTANALRLTSGPDANRNVLWIYNADSSVSRYTGGFDNSAATFYIQVFGRPKSQLLLPVTLTSFKGEQKAKGSNLLTWTTETEINNKGFELQRSADGNVFSPVAFINSKANNGSSVSTLHYQYSDEDPLNGNNYYRLKQRDNDGHFVFSALVLLQGDKSQGLKFTNVYPNPAKSVLNAVITSPANEAANISIADLTGKILINRSEKLVKGVNAVSFNVSKLFAGSYTIKVVSESTQTVSINKFVKQ